MRRTFQATHTMQAGLYGRKDNDTSKKRTKYYFLAAFVGICVPKNLLWFNFQFCFPFLEILAFRVISDGHFGFPSSSAACPREEQEHSIFLGPFHMDTEQHIQ